MLYSFAEVTIRRLLCRADRQTAKAKSRSRYNSYNGSGLWTLNGEENLFDAVFFIPELLVAVHIFVCFFKEFLQRKLGEIGG